MNAAVRAIRPIAIVAMIACADRPAGTTPIAANTPAATVVMGTIRGTVDVTAGTLTFDLVSSPLALRGSLGGISAAIYGDQGITTRIYNSTVVISAPVAGKKTFSANVGIRNLLAHSIGDEQAGTIPQDTIGIYAFVNAGPTVVSTSSPCPACTVTVQNQSGTRQFNAPAQKFWWWSDRVGAVGSARDTTLLRKAWVFQADTQVRVFSFDILVSATWPPANESRWNLEYPGDSAPHIGAEPRWRRNVGSTGTWTLNTPSAGEITLITPAGSSQYFSRLDSISTTSNAYMQARFQTNSVTVAPEVGFAMDDDTRLIGIGVTSTRVGFLDANFAFALPNFPAAATAMHTYQISKFGPDSAVLFMDGVRLERRLYSSFPASVATLPAFCAFGGSGTGLPPTSPGGNSSSWDYVIFEKGVTQP